MSKPTLCSVAHDPRLPKVLEMFGIPSDVLSFTIEAHVGEPFKVTTVAHSPVPEDADE